jgi:hypothetical protein
MRRATALFVVVGVVAATVGLPTHARAEGFWVSLAAGVAGGSTPSDYSEFWFDSPHAPPVVVTQMTGVTGSVQGTTAGGTTFFSGAGTPVMLPTTDGYATLSSSASFPASAIPRFAGGTQASGAPVGGNSPTSGAASLAMNFSTPASNGSQVLTVGLTGPDNATLGQGHVTVPGNGWWVVGLGPDTSGTGSGSGGNGSGNGTGTGSGNNGNGGGGDGSGGGGTPVPVPVGGGGTPDGGSVTTPEPSTMVLLGFGGMTAAGWRLRRR